jgi:hypothetical protein
MDTTITFSVMKYNLDDPDAAPLEYNKYTMYGNVDLDLHIKHFFVMFLDETLNAGSPRYVSAIGCKDNKSLDIQTYDRELYSVKAVRNALKDAIDIDLSKDQYVDMVNNLLVCHKYAFQYIIIRSGEELTGFERVHILALGRTDMELIRSDIDSKLKTVIRDPFELSTEDNNGIKFLHGSVNTYDGLASHITCVIYRIP